MQTREEMEQELRIRLKVATNSTVYPPTRITSLIKDAYMWATGLYIWDELVRARVTATKANTNYYDFPVDFRTNTIIRLTIDEIKYDRKNFETFEEYTSQNPTIDNVHMFANFGRQYFVFPTPLAVGVRNISVWGAIQAPPLGSNITKTIFSLSNEEGNEAVVEKAFAVAKGDKNHEDRATEILTTIQDKRIDSTQRDQVDRPLFDVPDFFGHGIGSFVPGNTNRY